MTGGEGNDGGRKKKGGKPEQRSVVMFQEVNHRFGLV